jgi:hypothetical protein
MRINTSIVRLVKSSFVDCELLLIAPFLGFFLFSFFNQSYDFSRKSLSKYLMDTIDFNKLDIDIFINLAKIVRYGRHWDESCNAWRLLLIIYFDGNFPHAKLRPYDDYKNMSTLNTYCGILSTCHNYKKNYYRWLNSLSRWDQRLRNQNKNSIIRWLACNM